MLCDLIAMYLMFSPWLKHLSFRFQSSAIIKLSSIILAVEIFLHPVILASDNELGLSNSSFLSLIFLMLYQIIFLHHYLVLTKCYI